VILKNYAALERGLLKLSTIPEQEAFPKIKDIEARLFRQRYLLEIHWPLAVKDYKQGVLLLPELEKGLERFGNKIGKHQLLTFYYLSAVLLFGNQQDEAALNWINRILKDTREKIVKEIYQFSRILNLLIHYRLGNLELLAALLPNTRRYLRDKRPLYQTEKRLFQYFKEKINAIDEKALLQSQESLKLDLEHLSKDKKEARVFNYIDLMTWAKEFG
jgi:hypothetical protein